MWIHDSHDSMTSISPSFPTIRSVAAKYANLQAGQSLDEHGFFFDRSLFAGVPVSYNTIYQYFRCDRCGEGIQSVTEHF
jgi:hypothetical protein